MTLELNPTESKWIDFIESSVVPRLEGSSAEKARTAAIVTWWALKEGILDMPNPWRHNLCHTGGDHQIGNLETCASSVWQVGMSGIQPASVSLAQVESVAKRLYPSVDIAQILSGIALDARVDSSTQAAVAASTRDLRKAWLLRDPAISFTLQRPFVEKGCISGSYSWCYGSWDTAKRFATNAAKVREVVSDLEARFSGSFGSGSPLLPWLLVLGLGVGLYLGHTHGYPSWVPRLLRV
jgi:hypothetical protein